MQMRSNAWLSRGLLVLLAGIVSLGGIGCDNPSASEDGWAGPTTYTLGETGPAGGVVFYDYGDYENGWRYLEAAGADLGGTYEWSPSNDFLGATERRVGAGKENTDLFIDAYGTGVGYAADVCATYAQNGYDDWFLPSMDELLFMQNQGLLDIAQTYWSSTEEDIGQAFAYDAGTDLISVTMKQTMFSSVRPTRRF